MRHDIRKDLLSVLSKVMDDINKKNYSDVLAHSNNVIHNASIYQDDDTLSVAVLVYALGKVMQRCCDKGLDIPKVISNLQKAYDSLKAFNMNNFRAQIKKILEVINKQDVELKRYIQEIITRAKIQKASHMHRHGISIARTAEILGLSQWELREYLGVVIDDAKYEGLRIEKRLSEARKRMKKLVFDAGPVIAITANNSLWLFSKLKELFSSELYMPFSVKQELVERGLETQKFRFEALQVGSLVRDKVFSIVQDSKIKKLSTQLLTLANSIFSYKGKKMRIVQRGEMEAFAVCIEKKCDAVVVDERVSRTLMESPSKLKKLMESRLHRKLSMNKDKLDEFRNIAKRVFILRSVELVTIAFENGCYDNYILDFPHAKRKLLESLLWGMKTEGASVTIDEIDQIVKLEGV